MWLWKIDVILLVLNMEGRGHQPRNEQPLKLGKHRNRFSSEPQEGG